MRPTWHKYLGNNAPRYTSYPSALAFSEDFDSAAYRKALRRIGECEPVSLYLHIPFCKQLCWYCGCNMRVENKASRISAYADDLLRELDLIADRLDGRGKVSQVHFGGGTPNTLPGQDLRRIVAKLASRFPVTRDTLIVMEIDPRLNPAENAAELVEAGVTRFSIGVQDFDPDVQLAINRVQPFDLVEGTVKALRRKGIADISFDILYGLPQQTLCGFRRTVHQVIDLRPERVSLFGYAHMPTRLRHQRLIREADLPSRPMRIALEEMAAATLVQAGYQRVGFDHYALPGTPIAEASRQHRLHRNFQGFTEDHADNVIATGLSAISQVHGVFAQNTKDLRAYQAMIREGTLPIDRGAVATIEEEDMGEWLRRLLCDMRGDLRQYCEITGADTDSWEQTVSRLQPLIADDIVRIESDEIIINDQATALARLVASVFDPAVKDPGAFASPAV